MSAQKNKNYASAQAAPLSDEELEGVGGGFDVIFQGDGVNRDSWFVSIVTRQMVQSSIKNYADAGAVPEIIQVGDRRFHVRTVGETYYVEAL